MQKKKECTGPHLKTHVRSISTVEMNTDQQDTFEKAIDALLADLVRMLDRRAEEINHGSNEKTLGGTRRDRRRPPE
jgi:hypothetical protein